MWLLKWILRYHCHNQMKAHCPYDFLWLLTWMLRYHCTVQCSSIDLAQMKTHWFGVVFEHAFFEVTWICNWTKKSEKSYFVQNNPKLQYLRFRRESEKRNNSCRVTCFKVSSSMHRLSKGQIISKAIFVFLTSPKKRTKKWKNLTCYYYGISSQIFFVRFFWRI